MADILISDLGAMAEAVHKDNDMLALQNVSSGETVKVSTQQLLDTVSSLTAMTDAVATTDVLVIHDTSAGVTKKVTPQQLFDIVPSLVIKGRDGGDVGGYLMDGVNDYITVPDNANLDVGTSDFSIEMFIYFNTIVDSQVIRKWDNATGFLLQLVASGSILYPRLQASGGSLTDLTTNPIVLTTNTWNHIVMTFDRDGNYVGYLNGIVKTTISIATLSADMSSASDLLLNGTVAPFKGVLPLFRLYNRVLTSTEIAAIYNNGRPDLYELSFSMRNAGLKYTSNFSAGVDGFAAQRVTATGNVDGVTDGVTSYDNVLSAYANADNNAHNVNKTITPSLLGKRVLEKFKIYIPSANTNVDGFQFVNASSPSSLYLTVHSIICVKVADGTSFGTVSGADVRNCKGYWLQVTADYTVPLFFENVGIGMLKVANDVFIGANSASDDLMYIYDYTRTFTGNVAEYLPHNAGSLGWIESSGNQLSGSTSGSPICLTKEIVRPPHYRDIRKAIAANTNTTLTGIVPKGYKIVSIRAKGSDSLADIKIGSASAGEQIVAATTTSSTTPKLLTLAATANDAYSESADVTLYARHDTGASGKTMDLIFHFEKVGN